MKIIRPEDLHTDDFLIERNKVRVKKELKKYNLTYENVSGKQRYHCPTTC